MALPVLQAGAFVLGAIGGEIADRFNAKELRKSAKWKRYSSDKNAKIVEKEGAKLVADQIVATASQGIDISSGTAERIFTTTEDEVAADAATIRLAGEMEASAMEASAGSIDRGRIFNLIGGGLSVGGSILGGS